MKRGSKAIGLCILTAGAGILISCFLPPLALVIIESVLLVLAGLICIKL